MALTFLGDCTRVDVEGDVCTNGNTGPPPVFD